MNAPPYYRDGPVALHLGEALDVLRGMPDCSVDAVVTDPPYGLADHHPSVISSALSSWLSGNREYVPAGKGFRGKDWDRFVPPPAVWDECLRVLKPGGHLVAFSAPRTSDLMGLSIRLAGFQIRDSLHWIYGEGFPKGQDISKSIDRRRDDRELILQVTAFLAAARDAAGWTNKRIDGLWGYNGMAGLWTTQGKAAIVPRQEQWDRLREAMGFDDAEIRPLVAELNARKGTLDEAWARREVIGSSRAAGLAEGAHPFLLGTTGRAADGSTPVTTPASEAARLWQGWNTSLKPAHEPIALARKSTGYDSAVASVLRHGTGALNIDATRTAAGQGRWPTNVLFGHGPDCEDGCAPGCPVPELGDRDRFFPVFRYEAKAPTSERPRLEDGTAHPTVKPLSLMRWLVRLVTPPGALVLDPFAGSGTTLQAAVAEGMRAVGVERHRPYADLARMRLGG